MLLIELSFEVMETSNEGSTTKNSDRSFSSCINARKRKADAIGILCFQKSQQKLAHRQVQQLDNHYIQQSEDNKYISSSSSLLQPELQNKHENSCATNNVVIDELSHTSARTKDTSTTNVSDIDKHSTTATTGAVANISLASTNTIKNSICTTGGRGAVVGWVSCPLCGKHSKKTFAIGRGISSHIHAVHTPWIPISRKIQRQRRLQQEHHERSIEKQRKTQLEQQLDQEQHQSILENQRKISEIFEDKETNITDANMYPEIPLFLQKHLEKQLLFGMAGWEPTVAEQQEWDEFVLNLVWELERTIESSIGEDGCGSIAISNIAHDNDKRSDEENFLFATTDNGGVHMDNNSDSIMSIVSLNEEAKSNINKDKITIIQPGFDRNGKPLPSDSYRDSLPLFLQAAANGDIQTIRSMIQKQIQTQHNSKSSDCDPSICDNEPVNNSELFTICTVEKAQAVQCLLDTCDRHQSTAEHWAAGAGHLECLRYLFQVRDVVSTFLAVATESEQKPLCSSSLSLQEHEHGEMIVVNTNDMIVNNSNRQPKLHHKRRLRLRQRRLRRRDGKTCLHYSARHGQLNCIQYLVTECNFDVNETSGDGTTPLHLACFGCHYSTVQYLVEVCHANVHAVNEWECSVAHWVAMYKPATTTTTDKDNHDVAVPVVVLMPQLEHVYSRITRTTAKTSSAHDKNPIGNGVSGCASYTSASRSFAAYDKQQRKRVWDLCNYLHSRGVSFVQRQKQGHTPLHKAAQRLNRSFIEWMMMMMSNTTTTVTANQTHAGDVYKCQQDDMSDVNICKNDSEYDNDGHRPSEIWLSFGGDEEFGKKMRTQYGW